MVILLVHSVILPAFGRQRFRWRHWWDGVRSGFQLSPSHAQLKKKNMQNNLGNMQHKRKPHVIKTTDNIHSNLRRVRLGPGTTSHNVSLLLTLGLNFSSGFECLNLMAHLIQWNLLSLPVNLSWYQDNSLWAVSVWSWSLVSISIRYGLDPWHSNSEINGAGTIHSSWMPGKWGTCL